MFSYATLKAMKSGQGPQHIGDLIRDKNIVLKGADVLSQRGFTQVPNHLLRSDKISAGAKLAYTMLLSYAWHNEFCFPGQERLAKDMGAGERSVVRYIQELEKEQFIKVQRRGQGRANLYELNLTTKSNRK
jgi:DNA-binding MarR family transcriptional regulator